MKHNVKELKVWQKSVDLSVEVYEATADFPSEEKFGLTSQMRRSVVSISSNIAEGAARNTDKEFGYFLGISNGSSFELMTQVMISQRLGMMEKAKAEQLLKSIDEIQKMTRVFSKTLKANNN